MKVMNRRLLLPAMMLLFFSGAIAQSGTNTSGIEALGEGGTVSATIGQPFFIDHNNGEFSLQEGVQQVYMITPLSANELYSFVEMEIFPNPTTNFISFRIGEGFRNGMEYRITDMQGKLLDKAKLIGVQTEIDFSQFSAGTYILQLDSESRFFRSFKIVKQ